MRLVYSEIFNIVNLITKKLVKSNQQDGFSARNVSFSEEGDKLSRTLKKVRRFLADAPHISWSTRQTRRTDEGKNFKRFQLIPKSAHKFSPSNSRNIMMAAHHLADYSRAIIITADYDDYEKSTASPILLFKVVPLKY